MSSTRFEPPEFTLRETVVYAVMVCFTCIGVSSMEGCSHRNM